MGDYCYMRVIVPREYIQAFRDLGFDFEFADDDQDGAPVITLADPETNYGHAVGAIEDGFGHMPKGIPYYGFHGAGHEYCALLFATDGKEMAYAPCFENTLDPVAAIDESGSPDPRDTERIAEYYRIRKSVQAQFAELCTKAGTPTPSL